MNTKGSTDNIVNLDQTIEDTEKEENIDGYKSIEHAFCKMKKIQKQMTMQKIFEMEKSLAKLEKELNAIIVNKSGE